MLPGAPIRSHLIIGPNVNDRVKQYNGTKVVGELFNICTSLNGFDVMTKDPMGYNW